MNKKSYFLTIILISTHIGTTFCTLLSPEPKILPRFWTNTGFSPIGPNSRKIFLSSDTLTNIELIGSLPNEAIKSIRIHWLLDLLRFESENDQKFEDLDKFLDFLVSSRLDLQLEFMSHDARFDWELDTYEVLKRYTVRYGIDVTSKWKLETWNEPDLKMYNVQNFTLSGE